MVSEVGDRTERGNTPSVSKRLPDAIRRLEALEVASGPKMGIPDIVRAVVGSEDPAENLLSLVKQCFELSPQPVSLENMARRILEIEEWIEVWT